METNTEFRSVCPTTSAIDVVGDKWSLVIVKQMLLEGIKTFKDFSESEEAIASNILSSRLKKLEEFNIITKNKLPNNKKSNIYTLTQIGLELTPTIVELTLWGEKNVKEFNPNLESDDRIIMLRNDKEGFIKMLIEKYKKENWLQHQI